MVQSKLSKADTLGTRKKSAYENGLQLRYVFHDERNEVHSSTFKTGARRALARVKTAHLGTSRIIIHIMFFNFMVRHG